MPETPSPSFRADRCRSPPRDDGRRIALRWRRRRVDDAPRALSPRTAPPATGSAAGSGERVHAAGSTGSATSSAASTSPGGTRRRSWSAPTSTASPMAAASTVPSASSRPARRSVPCVRPSRSAAEVGLQLRRRHWTTRRAPASSEPEPPRQQRVRRPGRAGLGPGAARRRRDRGRRGPGGDRLCGNRHGPGAGRVHRAPHRGRPRAGARGKAVRRLHPLSGGATKYRLAFLGRQAHTGPTRWPSAGRPAGGRLPDRRPEGHGGRLRARPAHLGRGAAGGLPELAQHRPERGGAVHRAALRRAGDPGGGRSTAQDIHRRGGGAGRRRIGGPRHRSAARGRHASGLVRLAERAGARNDAPPRPLDTIGGHDAISLAAVCPAIVLAVPCRDG